jgi:ribosomal protein S18 acetylase RimI-like enzyme
MSHQAAANQLPNSSRHQVSKFINGYLNCHRKGHPLMTIWTVELLHQTRASLNRLTRAFDVDLPKQRSGGTTKSTLQNLQTASALGVQEVIIVAENGEAVGVATVRRDTNAQTGYARLMYVVPGVEAAVADMLIQEVFERVWSDPAIAHFDCQTFVNQPDIRAAFATHGLQPMARHNMELMDLAPFLNKATPTLPDGFHMKPWWPEPGVSLSDDHLDAVADLIIEAYQGTNDENLYPGLNTRAGLRQFFEETLYDKRGAFNHDTSRIIYAGEGTARIAGQIFCSRTIDNTAFVLEIGVRPEYRGQGLGRALLTNVLQSAADQGLAGVQLSVTDDNPARHLYESVGFKAVTPFWVYVTTRPEPSTESTAQNE